jgi:acetyl-CoA C-acetyltransferase
MQAFIYDAIRLPRGKGKRGGALSELRPVDLLVQQFRALAARNGLGDGALVDDVLLGCSSATGEQGANIAKIAALCADWSPSVPAAVVSRFCASGLSAIGDAAARIAAGAATLMVAGGVESTSRVPMFADGGAWFADERVAERTGFVHMGVSADLIASREGYARSELDALALRSQRRAARARDADRFTRLVPAEDADGSPRLRHDETIRDATSEESLAQLAPLFGEQAQASQPRWASRLASNRTMRALHTLGSSPALADGASLLLLGSRAAGVRLGLEPLARIAAVAHHGVDPVLMLTGNVEASAKALATAKMTVDDIDVFEVNESFAAVVLHYQRALGIDDEKLNAHGGAIALGHPLGATGGILAGMALERLEHHGGTTALVSICGGAGLATSIVLERL